VTPQTLFFTGSTTKAFTAAAFSSLVDDNERFPEVQWTTPISQIIRDDFVLENENCTQHVTFEDAMSHRTGLPRHDLACGIPDRTLRETVRSMRHLPLTAPLRTTFQYGNLMWATVGYVVEHLTGQWLGDVIRERIWEPLGMSETFFKLNDTTHTPSGRQRLSRGYRWSQDSASYAPVEYLDFSVVEGAGAIISNVLDYSSWLRTMIYASPPLSPACHAAITSSHSIVADTASGSMDGLPQSPFVNVETYGFGWWRRVYRNHLIIHHDGGLTGYGSLVLYIPRQEWGVTMMANTSGTSAAVQTILAYYLIDELLNVPENERFDWTTLVEQQLLSQEANLKAAPDKLFPSTPSPPLAPALPFNDYEGTYTHPGYGSFVFSYDRMSVGLDSNPAFPWMQYTHHLKATVMRTREISVNLTHVSGEFWLLRLMLGEGGEKTGIGKAQFRIGAGGQVEELGFEMEGEMKLSRPGDMLWLKIES
jgi:CubicO group peptidase (beta-lactamase class C family)